MRTQSAPQTTRLRGRCAGHGHGERRGRDKKFNRETQICVFSHPRAPPGGARIARAAGERETYMCYVKNTPDLRGFGQRRVRPAEAPPRSPSGAKVRPQLAASPGSRSVFNTPSLFATFATAAQARPPPAPAHTRLRPSLRAPPPPSPTRTSRPAPSLTAPRPPPSPPPACRGAAVLGSWPPPPPTPHRPRPRRSCIST